MTRFRSILAATDFSGSATQALRRAARLAEQHAARLTLLHVVDDTGFKALRDWFSPSIDHDLKVAQARATLRGFAAEIRGRHRVAARFRVVIGEPFQEIRRASEGADLVVLGPRGRNPLKDLVTGSTADRLLRSCRRAMLVVKHAANGAYRRVLVPLDFTVHAPACLRAAGALAPTADLHVFHALDSSRDFELRMAGVPAAVIRDHERAEIAKAHGRVLEVGALAGLAPGRFRTVVRCGPPWACTLEQADALGAELLVVGKQGATQVADFLLGSFTRRMLASSKCDLLVVPPAAGEQLLQGSGVALPAMSPGRGHRVPGPAPAT